MFWGHARTCAHVEADLWGHARTRSGAKEEKETATGCGGMRARGRERRNRPQRPGKTRGSPAPAIARSIAAVAAAMFVPNAAEMSMAIAALIAQLQRRQMSTEVHALFNAASKWTQLRQQQATAASRRSRRRKQPPPAQPANGRRASRSRRCPTGRRPPRPPITAATPVNGRNTRRQSRRRTAGSQGRRRRRRRRRGMKGVRGGG